MVGVLPSVSNGASVMVLMARVVFPFDIAQDFVDLRRG